MTTACLTWGSVTVAGGAEHPWRCCAEAGGRISQNYGGRRGAVPAYRELDQGCIATALGCHPRGDLGGQAIACAKVENSLDNAWRCNRLTTPVHDARG